MLIVQCYPTFWIGHLHNNITIFVGQFSSYTHVIYVHKKFQSRPYLTKWIAWLHLARRDKSNESIHDRIKYCLIHVKEREC